MQPHCNTILITFFALLHEPLGIDQRLRTESRAVLVRLDHVAGVAQRGAVDEALETHESQLVGRVFFFQLECLSDVHFHVRRKEHAHFQFAAVFEASAGFMFHDPHDVYGADRSDPFAVRDVHENLYHFFLKFRRSVEGFARHHFHGGLFEEKSGRLAVFVSFDDTALWSRGVFIDAAKLHRFAVYPNCVQLVVECDDRAVREILVEGFL